MWKNIVIGVLLCAFTSGCLALKYSPTGKGALFGFALSLCSGLALGFIVRRWWRNRFDHNEEVGDLEELRRQLAALQPGANDANTLPPLPPPGDPWTWPGSAPSAPTAANPLQALQAFADTLERSSVTFAAFASRFAQGELSNLKGRCRDVLPMPCVGADDLTWLRFASVSIGVLFVRILNVCVAGLNWL